MTIVTPVELAEQLYAVVVKVFADHGLDSAPARSELSVRRPRLPEYGDYTTNVALRVGGKAGVSARELAGWIAAALGQVEGVAQVEVAGPGFVNIRLASSAPGAVLTAVLAAGQDYGWPAGCRAHAEFASAVVTTEALIEAVGMDAARYAMARSAVDTDVDIDPERWAACSDENPVYCVQYAHSRLVSSARNAAELGVDGEPDYALLTTDQEGELVRTIAEYPLVVSTAAARCEPHRVARHLEELVGAYHRFSTGCRILPEGDEAVTSLHVARLRLGEATRQVLANGLGLLGITAPERM